MRESLLAVLVLAAGLSACDRSTPADSRAATAGPIPFYGVRSGNTAAYVRGAPFQLSVIDVSRFYSGDGKIALFGDYGDGQPLPEPIYAVAEPAPLGAELPKSPTLYAPLAFVVGSQQAVQQPAGVWQTDVLTGATGGVAFHATDIQSLVSQDEHQVHLILATNDPSGRTIDFTLGAVPSGGIRVSAKVVPDTGVAAMADSFFADATDAFRGFGGRHNALDQRGNDFLGWVQQENAGAGELQPVASTLPGGDEHYLFPNGKTAAYYVAPSFVSNRYAFLLNRDEMSRWRMASDGPADWQVQVAAPAIDYTVIAGIPSETIPLLTQLTGRHRAPPAWVTGIMLDRSTVPFTGTAAQYAQQVQDDLAKIDQLQLPVTGYRFEGWFELAPDLRHQLAAQFHQRGIHVLAYFRAFTAPDTAGTEDPAVFQDAVSNDYVANTVAGTPYLFGGNFFSPSALIDFTSAPAVKWWKARITDALDEGVDGFMQDFGEQALMDMQFAGGTGAQLHNRLTALYHRATREAIDDWLLRHPGHEDIWFFTRAGYAGLDGAATYEGGNFAGDGNTDFSVSSGLGSQAPDMLNRAIGGAWGFTTDIGGYFDYVSPATTKELFIRWAEWAVLSPVMRVHGSANAGTHMPWIYDDETLAIWRQLSALRLRAQPYIQRLWAEAAQTGIPVTRPLWLAAPGDALAAAEDQEWLLGDDVLVAPVVTEGATSRKVYFPAGCWQQPATGAQFNGPNGIDVPAALATLPYFFRCGAKPF